MIIYVGITKSLSNIILKNILAGSHAEVVLVLIFVSSKQYYWVFKISIEKWYLTVYLRFKFMPSLKHHIISISVEVLKVKNRKGLKLIFFNQLFSMPNKVKLSFNNNRSCYIATDFLELTIKII